MGFAPAIYFAAAIQRHDMSCADNRAVFLAEQQQQCNWPRAAQVLLFCGSDANHLSDTTFDASERVFVKIPNQARVKKGLLIQSDLLLRFAD
jgi:hypothetical protein